jgi:serine/threonine-protein phosphatase 2A activator
MASICGPNVFLFGPNIVTLFPAIMALLPPLRSVSLTRPIQPPEKIIKNDTDVDIWKHTTGYKDYCLFVSRLNDAIRGRDIPSVEQEERSTVSAA